MCAINCEQDKLSIDYWKISLLHRSYLYFRMKRTTECFLAKNTSRSVVESQNILFIIRPILKKLGEICEIKFIKVLW